MTRSQQNFQTTGCSIVQDGAFVPLKFMGPLDGDPYLTIGRDTLRPALRVVK